VVIVEDPDEGEFLSRLLDHAGIPAAPFVSLAAAREALQSGDAGSLIVGMVLGRESGLEVIEQVRKHDDPETAQMPVVVIAEASRPMDRLRLWEGGADSFLTKPFHFEELVEALSTAAASDPAERAKRRRQRFEAERKQIAEGRRR